MKVDETLEKKIHSEGKKSGQIIVTIHKAKDIEKKGMFGKADPDLTP